MFKIGLIFRQFNAHFETFRIKYEQKNINATDNFATKNASRNDMKKILINSVKRVHL